MAKSWRFIRSSIFILIIYGWMLLFGLLTIPHVLVRREAARKYMKMWCRHAIFFARVLCGINVEIRGKPPEGNCLIASKHQSFFDIILLAHTLPRVSFVMKEELLRVPVLGFYAKAIGCTPVRRGDRTRAITQLMKGLETNDTARQLVIYPQGTRVAPGDVKPYKIGAALLYQGATLRCVPVAVNVGLFWPRKGIMRNPGTAVVSFLEPIEPGLEPQVFVRALEACIEPASNALMAEAGFTVLQNRDKEKEGA